MAVQTRLNQTQHHRTHISGFTLMELAVVMIVVGVLMGSGVWGYAHYTYRLKAEATEQKFDIVLDALSAYAQRYARLPCPALPDATGANMGAERNNGECFIHNPGEAGGTTLYTNTQGIVPWRELGIPESLVKDGWGRYITYKPAPQLTVNNFSEEMQDIADTGTRDIHNSCRSPLWFTESNQHIDRAKALFCCNAAPKAAYLGDIGQPTNLSSNWRDQAIMAAGVATGGFDASSTTPTNVPVQITNAWADDPNDNNMNGSFEGPRYGTEWPDAPMLRATGNAVTLISHGGNGFLSFLRGQASTVRQQANVNGGISNPAAQMAADEQLNVWPPQVAAATIAHPKAAAGSYDPFGKQDGASDDRVAFLRSDQVYARLGSASCIRPASTGLEPNNPECSAGLYGDMTYVLDTSGSMTSRAYGSTRSRMSVAKEALSIVLPELLEQELTHDEDPDMLGFNQFNPNAGRSGCGALYTETEEIFDGFQNNEEPTPENPNPPPFKASPETLDAARQSLLDRIASAKARGNTPLAETLRATADAMYIDQGGGNYSNGSEDEPNAIVFISDGEDTCGGDVVAVAQYIAMTYPNLHVHVIDVANNSSLARMHDPFTRTVNGQPQEFQMKGKYHQVSDPEELAAAMAPENLCNGNS